MRSCGPAGPRCHRPAIARRSPQGKAINGGFDLLEANRCDRVSVAPLRALRYLVNAGLEAGGGALLRRAVRAVTTVGGSLDDIMRGLPGAPVSSQANRILFQKRYAFTGGKD
jgi:hypothetical protein